MRSGVDEEVGADDLDLCIYFIHVLNLFGMTQCIAALSATFNDSIAIPCTIALVAFLCRNLGQVALHMFFGLPSTFSTAYSPW